MVKILKILKVEICQVEEDIPPSDLPPGLTLVGSSVAKISSEATQTVLLARLGILSQKGKRISRRACIIAHYELDKK